MIDGDWLLHHVHALGQVGATPEGGRTRLCYTPEDDAGRAYVRRLMSELGLAVREDVAGNLFGRLPGRDDSLPVVLLGSHVDTVPNAGAYDGCLGVLAALSAVRSWRERGIKPLHPVEVVAFMGEESSRFGLALIGSRLFTGTLDWSELDRYRDADGITLRQVLVARGATPESLAAIRPAPGALRCYLELHIEQGAYLDQAGRQIGIVTGIAAPTRLLFLVRGEAAHSGACAPEHRKDALMAASHVLSHIEDLVRREAGYGTVATVGRLNVRPNAINVVPGEVEFTLDVRGVDEMSRRRLVRSIQRELAREAARRGMEVEVRLLGEDAPVPLPRSIQELSAAAAERLGLSWMPMPSMAGHDAMQVARLCPAGMLFCRNVSRTSHSPQEYIAPADAVAGARLLAEVALQLAEGEGL